MARLRERSNNVELEGEGEAMTMRVAGRSKGLVKAEMV